MECLAGLVIGVEGMVDEQRIGEERKKGGDCGRSELFIGPRADLCSHKLIC